MLKTKDKMNGVIVKHTGQPLERVIKDTDRDYRMDAQESLTYGIVDKIITERNNAKKSK